MCRAAGMSVNTTLIPLAVAEVSKCWTEPGVQHLHQADAGVKLVRLVKGL